MIDPGFFRGLGRARLAAVTISVTIVLATMQAHAQDPDSVFRSIAKQTGAATDVSPPADFVLKSRPDAPTEVIPVFRTPEEPPSTLLTPKQLKAMDAELDSAGKKHDVLRAGFAPSAKAVAEAEAAKKAKRRKKPPETAKPASATPGNP